jgi:hypothetical protein
MSKSTDGKLALDTLTVMGNKYRTIVNKDDLERSESRPFTTWKIKDGAVVEHGKPQGAGLLRKKWDMDRTYFYTHKKERFW